MKQGMKTKKKEQQGIFKKWLLGLVLVGVITAGACGQSSTQPAESVPAAAAETTIAADVATEAPPTSMTETTAETATDSAIAETMRRKPYPFIQTRRENRHLCRSCRPLTFPQSRRIPAIPMWQSITMCLTSRMPT